MEIVQSFFEFVTTPFGFPLYLPINYRTGVNDDQRCKVGELNSFKDVANNCFPVN